MVAPGSVVEPAAIKRFKSRVAEGRIVEVNEHNFDKWHGYFKIRMNIEIKLHKTDEVKTEEVKTEEVKTDEVKTEEVKTEEVKTDEVKTDEVKTDEVKTEEVKTDEVKTEEVKTVPIVKVVAK